MSTHQSCRPQQDGAPGRDGSGAPYQDGKFARAVGATIDAIGDCIAPLRRRSKQSRRWRPAYIALLGVAVPLITLLVLLYYLGMVWRWVAIGSLAAVLSVSWLGALDATPPHIGDWGYTISDGSIRKAVTQSILAVFLAGLPFRVSRRVYWAVCRFVGREIHFLMYAKFIWYENLAKDIKRSRRNSGQAKAQTAGAPPGLQDFLVGNPEDALTPEVYEIIKKNRGRVSVPSQPSRR